MLLPGGLEVEVWLPHYRKHFCSDDLLLPNFKSSVLFMNSLGFQKVLLPLFQLCSCFVPFLLFHVQLGLQSLSFLFNPCLHLHHLVRGNLLPPLRHRGNHSVFNCFRLIFPYQGSLYMLEGFRCRLIHFIFCFLNQQ